MKGDLIINGVDVYDVYGIYVLNGGYDDLLTYPSTKKVSYNDWHEYDGIEPDLERICLDAKQSTISIGCNMSYTRMLAFFAFLEAMAESEYYFAEIGLTKKLRLVGYSNVEYNEIGRCSLVVSEDIPMNGYTYLEPINTGVILTDYTIDGVDLGRYGISVLYGTIEAMQARGKVKPNLLRNISILNGILYDSKTKVTKSNREVSISCQISAPNYATLYRNYNALLYDLIRSIPNNDVTKQALRTIVSADIGGSVECYYKSASVQMFDASDTHPSIAFTLHFVAI